MPGDPPREKAARSDFIRRDRAEEDHKSGPATQSAHNGRQHARSRPPGILSSSGGEINSAASKGTIGRPENGGSSVINNARSMPRAASTSLSSRPRTAGPSQDAQLRPDAAQGDPLRRPRGKKQSRPSSMKHARGHRSEGAPHRHPAPAPAVASLDQRHKLLGLRTTAEICFRNRPRRASSSEERYFGALESSTLSVHAHE